MSRDGDKIADAMNRFQQSIADAPGTGDTNPLGILRTRSTLRHMHFERTRELHTRAIEAMPEKLYLHCRDSRDTNPNQLLAARTLEMLYAYMNVFKADTDIYTPTYNHVDMSYNVVTYTIRRFPLTLIAPHVEFRYIQRSAQPLRYAEMPFTMALTCAIAFSHILEHTPPEGRRRTTPCCAATQRLILGPCPTRAQGHL